MGALLDGVALLQPSARVGLCPMGQAIKVGVKVQVEG